MAAHEERWHSSGNWDMSTPISAITDVPVTSLITGHYRISNSRSIYTFDPNYLCLYRGLLLIYFVVGQSMLRNVYEICEKWWKTALSCMRLQSQRKSLTVGLFLCDFANILGYGPLILHRITRQIDIERRYSHTAFWMRMLKESGNCCYRIILTL